MKQTLTIKLILLSFAAFCQTDTMTWHSSGDENSITKYEVQKATDTGGVWVTVKTFEKGKDSYVYLFTRENVFWHILATGKQTFVTRPMIWLSQNRVSVTSAVKSSSALTWSTKDEKNVSYYLIEKTLDNKKYSTTTKISALGDRKYSYKYSKTLFSYKYRLTVFYKDGSKGVTVNFK